MILYVEKPKDYTTKNAITEFRKVAGYKINIQKQVTFLYTDIELSEWEAKKTISHNCFKWTKYLGINLTKDVKDLYSENHKTPKKEIEEDINKWKHILCSRVWEVTSLNYSYQPKQSTHSTQFLSRYQWHISQN